MVKKAAKTKKANVGVRDLKPRKGVKGGAAAKPPASGGSLVLPRLKWE